MGGRSAGVSGSSGSRGEGAPSTVAAVRWPPAPRAGVATSLVQSAQQWDAPNAWPPLQHMVVEALLHAGVEGAADLARDVAGRWLRSVLLAFQRTGQMHEKYDAAVPGQRGGGGEYQPQVRTRRRSTDRATYNRSHRDLDAGQQLARVACHHLLTTTDDLRARRWGLGGRMGRCSTC